MQKLRSRRFRFEALERRTMLAGDVQVSIDNGTLVIIGDANANDVVVEGGAGGSAVITGDNSTRIFFNNTEQQQPLEIPGANFDNITVDLNAGNDTLAINNVSVVNLDITTDEGADFVRLGAYQAYAANPGGITSASGSIGVSGLLRIDTGSGADLVQVVRVFGAADWDINLGDSDGTTNNSDNRSDNDFAVALDDQIYIFIGSGDAIDVNGGTGDDLININYLTVSGTLLVDGVSGNDVISVNGTVFNNHVSLFGGNGFDTIAVDFSRQNGTGAAAVVEIDSGADADFILFARSLIDEGDVVIRSGGGFDDLVIGRYYANARGDLATGGNVADRIFLDTGGEDDFADIRGNDVFDFFATFGGGNDDVDFINNRVRNQGGLDGGAGSDDLTFLGNLANNFSVVGFERQNSSFNQDNAG
jgi:hypothetical protein